MRDLSRSIGSPGRSWLFVPGSSERYLTKAIDCDADALLLDLEDGVTADDKTRARELLSGLLAERTEQVRFVRVNDLSTGLTATDLIAVLRPGLHGVCLPKTESADDVRRVSHELEQLEIERGIEPGSTMILPAIESARSLLAAPEIAASNPRVAGLIFGAEDYALDLGLLTNRQHEAADLAYARSAIVVAAAAARVLSVDGVYPHLNDMAGLASDARRSRDFGFTGKSTFSPRQLPLIHEVFAPDPDEIDFSRRALAAFETAVSTGIGSVVVDGQLIDLPIAMRARRVLERSGVR